MKIKYLILIISSGILFACVSEKDHLVTFQTRHGDMVAVLYDETPQHKTNFIELAESGRYDSTDFHRIIKDFMIQGGDVFGKENLPQEEWYTIPAEFNDNFIHEKGSIAAARQGDNINPEKRSSGSQFYIVQGRVYDPEELTTDMERLQEVFIKYLQLGSNKSLKEKYEALYQEGDFEGMGKLMIGEKTELEKFFNTDLSKTVSPQQLEAYTSIGGTPHLDVGYTVFGKIIDGLEVIDKIAAEETTVQDRPRSPVYMKVTVKEMLKKEITKKYGYEYPNSIK
jgi:peptidyl-prolyl cis-trans isomerase B (cyclophilin B)